MDDDNRKMQSSVYLPIYMIKFIHKNNINLSKFVQNLIQKEINKNH